MSQQALEAIRKGDVPLNVLVEGRGREGSGGGRITAITRIGSGYELKADKHIFPVIGGRYSDVALLTEQDIVDHVRLTKA